MKFVFLACFTILGLGQKAQAEPHGVTVSPRVEAVIQDVVQMVSTNPGAPLSVEQLEQLGFKRVGNTDYYQLDKLFIKKEAAGWKLNYSYLLSTPIEKIQGLQILKSNADGGAESLIFQSQKDGKPAYHDYRSEWNVEEYEAHFKNAPHDKSLVDQLVKLGFQPDPKEEGILTRSFAPGRILKALVSDGKLVGIIQPFPSVIGLSEVTGLGTIPERDRLEGPKGHMVSFRDNKFDFNVPTEDRYWQGPVQVTNIREQFKDENIGMQVAPLEKQDGGFVVGAGNNPTGVIRSMKAINGIRISELEDSMRPQRMSEAGFLGPNESLLGVLAEDNDFVQSQKMTHQQLAHPLKYFNALDGRGYLHYPAGSKVLYNGIPFFAKAEHWRGMQQSPFNDGTGASTDIRVTNLEDGSALGYSPLVGEMIDRYGFYEGHGTRYRVEPKDVIATFGFGPDYKKHLETDPVAQLAKDVDAHAKITSEDHLTRMANLKDVRRDLFQGNNYQVEINDGNLLVSVAYMLLDEEGRYGRLRDHLKFGDIKPSTIPLDWVSGLLQGFDKLPESVARELEKAITKVTIDPNRHNYWDFALNSVFKAALGEGRQRDFATLLLSRLDTSKIEPIEFCAKVKELKERTDPAKQKAFVGLIEKHMAGPMETWRKSIEQQRPLLESSGVQLPKVLSVQDLFELSDRAENMMRGIDQSLEFARRVGNLRGGSRADMAHLFRLIATMESKPDYKLTDSDQTMLERMKVDPDLIRHGIQVAKKEGYNEPGRLIPRTATVLYNGQAQREKTLQQNMNQLPKSAPPEIRAAMEKIIKAKTELGQNDFDLKAFIGAISSMKRPSEQAVLKEYASRENPNLRSFIGSRFVTCTLKNDSIIFGYPVGMRLNQTEIDKLKPVKEEKDFLDRPKKTYELKVGGDTLQLVNNAYSSEITGTLNGQEVRIRVEEDGTLYPPLRRF